MLNIYSTQDRNTSVHYTVAGELVSALPFTPITDTSVLFNAPALLRLDRVFFAIDKGLHLSLHWQDEAQTLIMPLEDRGYFDFESAFGGWSNPRREGYTGNILLRVLDANDERRWLFALKLDFTKQTR